MEDQVMDQAVSFLFCVCTASLSRRRGRFGQHRHDKFIVYIVYEPVSSSSAYDKGPLLESEAGLALPENESYRRVGTGVWAQACGRRRVGAGVWAQACGRRRVGTGVWVQACGRRRVGAGVWVQACGYRRVGAGVWAQACGYRRVGAGVWAQACGYRRVGAGVWAQACGYRRVGAGVWDSERGNKETGLERVIDSVASFRKPGVTGRGLYELKPEWSKHFNLYFHHYSRADQSKASISLSVAVETVRANELYLLLFQAEEAQRKARSQPGPAGSSPGPAGSSPGPAGSSPGPGSSPGSALVPPVPPPFCPLFASLVNLLQCDVLLSLETTVLQWASESGSESGSGSGSGSGSAGWTESMLQRVLHLISMALMEEQQQLQSNSEEELTFNFSLKIQRPGSCGSSVSLLSLLETLHNASHLELHKDMISWILKTVSDVKTLRERSDSTATVSSAPNDPVDKLRERDKAERKRKAEMARLRREKVMAQMSAMQKHFINENKELFHQNLEPESAPCSASEELHRRQDSPGAQVCVGPARVGVACVSHVTCILCQEEQEVRAQGRAMVLAAFVQRSTVLSQNRQSSCSQSQSRDVVFMSPELALGIHTASCGHIMHASCWQRYFEAVQQKEQRRQQRLRGHTSFDVENGEFLCPLCECLSNTVIPLLPPATAPATR
ncbi:hypothetical protein WMY93_033161 [Mugilogobius chulae]|uniref:E3 ubiquitin-protein ligase n=1 Tax=Mugilogobius chulae TaxID=88201 RepID=A0AAW0MIP8_9GOBI